MTFSTGSRREKVSSMNGAEINLSYDKMQLYFKINICIINHYKLYINYINYKNRLVLSNLTVVTQN